MSRLPRSSVAAVAATLAATIVVASPTIALAKHSSGGGGSGGGSSSSSGSSSSTSSGSSSSSTSTTSTPAVDPIYSGRAYGVEVGVQTLVLGLIGATLGPVFVSDTGQLPSTGGSLDAQLATVSVPLGGVNVNADIVNGVTVGNSGTTDSSAETVGMTANVDTLLNVSADVLHASAKAVCPVPLTTPTSPTLTGNADLLHLKVNLLGANIKIPVNPAPNTTLNLDNGLVVIILNEQTQTGTSISVNALHIKVNGALSPLSTVADADIVISHADAGVTCGLAASGGGSSSGSPSPSPSGSGSSSTSTPTGTPTGGNPGCTGNDFMTGGGQIVDSNGKVLVSFGFVGGYQGGTLKGHFNAVDKNTSPSTKYDGTGVLTYYTTGATSRQITYSTDTGSLVVNVADNSTPGTYDTISFASYSGNVSGNIDLHQAGTCSVPSAP